MNLNLNSPFVHKYEQTSCIDFDITYDQFKRLYLNTFVLWKCKIKLPFALYVSINNIGARADSRFAPSQKSLESVLGA